MSDFKQGPDLTNPTELARALNDYAGGLEQQATAADQGSALGGHPYPAFFYRMSADAMKAAAKMITEKVPVPPPAPVVEAPGTAAPPAQPEPPKVAVPAPQPKPAVVKG